ncbi:uncharacterized protein LOC109831493 [Asparagus officinalis]|uniref:uncharacterized protein LOC109831493 n=1 Tax=Asparagus officinalis TaxID=4686 RepID=UPI00098E48AD|nr:uncharacterized protein LOC109831493 [Asparagus officinalis]
MDQGARGQVGTGRGQFRGNQGHRFTSQAGIICQTCGRANHLAKYCWDLQKYATNYSETEIAALTSGVGGVTLFEPTENSRVVDSGAANHIANAPGTCQQSKVR